MWQGCPRGQPARPAAVPYRGDKDLTTRPVSLCLDVTLPPVLCWDREVLFGLSAVALTPSISGSLTVVGCWETLARRRWHSVHASPCCPQRGCGLGTAPRATFVTTVVGQWVAVVCREQLLSHSRIKLQSEDVPGRVLCPDEL